ncbi:MAG: hypothetical protein WD360_07490 [Nitriliruptoraceae bacterium]
MYDRDYTVFGTDPTELSDRLNWLIAPTVTDVDLIERFTEDVVRLGVDDVVLCGMGGSSLYPRTLVPFATDPKRKLTVVDTTDPDALRRIDAAVNYDRALVIAASKSGTTIETAAQHAFFADRLTQHHGTDANERLSVITDPGSSLARDALAKGYRHVLLADPHVGGRFSAHTVFGVAPAALVGVDPLGHLAAAQQTFTQLAEASQTNVAVILGAHLAAAVTGRNGVANVGIELADATDPLGLWIEQLIAESLGKHGRGLHVLLRASSPPQLTVKIVTDPTVNLPHLHVADNPQVLTLTVPDGHKSVAVTASVFMLATALAGRGLAVNPFDQPDVAAAKQATAAALNERTSLEDPVPIASALEGCTQGHSVVVLAYTDPDSDLAEELWAAAATLGRKRNVAASVGFGPRYLHSTGQLHKGALSDACYLMIGPNVTGSLAIPDRDYGFETLFAAQAAGDIAALRERSRNVSVITADELTGYVSSL